MDLDQLLNFKKTIYIATILTIIFLASCATYLFYLKQAHSSFESYYAFRGCVQLIEKTDTYATCKLPNGNIIKLVQVDSKWYLDGDLGW